MCACLLAFQLCISCFSSFINSRVTGINVSVSKRIGSKFSDLYLDRYLTKIFIFILLYIILHEPTNVVNFIKTGVG